MIGKYVAGDPEYVAVTRAIKRWCQYRELDVVGGVLLITLGDPTVTTQYLGPNVVSALDVIDYIDAVYEALHSQVVKVDQP